MTLTNQQGLSVKVTNFVIPFQSFRLAAALDGDGNGDGPVRVTGATVCAQIATYGPFLQRLGLCNPASDVLSVVGAAELTRFAGAQAPTMTEVGTVSFAATGTEITATLAASSLRLADHVAALLLVDEATDAPLALDYGLDTRRSADAAGHLSSVTLPIRGKQLPASVRAYLIVDVTAVATATVIIP
jgi:hypothetical protein